MAEPYTEDELLGLYRDGKDDPHILEKLSDLACKPKGEILNILHLHGQALDIQPEDKPKAGRNKVRHTEEMWRKAVGLRAAGESWERVSSQTGIPVLSLKNDWRKKARAFGMDAAGDAAAETLYFAPDPGKESVYGRDETKTAKERLSDALYTAVSSLKALSAGDNFSIAYVDHQFSVSYSMTIRGGI